MGQDIEQQDEMPPSACTNSTSQVDGEPLVKRDQIQSRKIRNAAPDGRRRKRKTRYDGSSPLEYPGHEAVARYLAAPKPLRRYKSDSQLAKHYRVERMTLYRWKQRTDVIQRAYFLSTHNQMLGDLFARQEWPRIVQMAAKMAIKGDLQAMKFCESRAWFKELRVQESLLDANISIEDLLGTNDSEDADERQDDHRQIDGDHP